MLAPSQYRLYATINEYEQAARILSQVRKLAYTLGSPNSVYEIISPVTAGQVQQYVKDVDPSRLAGLRVVDVKFPRAHLASNARILADFAAQAKAYGADEKTERLALFLWDGNYYEVGFQLLRYGGDWIVLSQNSVLSDLDSSGAPQAITPDEFNAKTGS
jgi:hypothetical protein